MCIIHNHLLLLTKFIVMVASNGRPRLLFLFVWSRKQFMQEIWYIASSATKSLNTRIQTGMNSISPCILSLLSQHLMRVSINGNVSTLATVEYFRIVFLVQRKQFFFQSKVFSMEDRNLFLGISKFLVFRINEFFLQV